MRYNAEGDIRFRGNALAPSPVGHERGAIVFRACRAAESDHQRPQAGARYL
jgi:hypothetical protein